MPLIKALWVIAVAAVGASALVPVPQTPELPGYTDKLVHLGCYLVLGLLAVLGQRHARGRLAASLAMVVFGVVIELVQNRLPWRSFEWADIVANTIGVVVGGSLAVIGTRLRAPPAG
ncbi:VanZ family protein [Sinimarinibacterium flocculans]|uniref:VanZ family protein n=1 Tax=Sinimarinibacterium flocculans TaxID=985250 RepID=UPI0035170906